MSSKQAQLESLIEPIVQSFDCVFWGLEYMTQGKNALLRIFIDKKDGIAVEDCEQISRQVSAVMDVEDPISGEYTLEVSSPGLDRPLYKLDQYKEYVGSQVKLRLRIAFEGRRKFTGLLKGIEDDEVVLEIDKEEYVLPFELIDKGNVVPTF